nr:restriction endonuclease subunit R [Gammaproteobacteria bacterium]
TTELLSEQGFVVTVTDDTGEDQQETYKQREFERRFFSSATNQLFCKTFMENALRDPVSGEIGKSIIFAVSQKHATGLTQILNEMADRMFPGKYQSDFAVQVTSQIPDAQQFTINFANNNLLGSANFLPAYKTSKARVCVTVGMMTTGYDCPDILNLGLFRPVFSPTDFIQIKGRGTRKHDFLEQLFDNSFKEGVSHPNKTAFKLFDFFANCEYFETEFNYDEVLKLPRPRGERRDDDDGLTVTDGTYEHLGADIIASVKEQAIGYEGMKIDRMFFEKFEDTVRENETIAKAVEAEQWDKAIDCVHRQILDKPKEYFTLDKLRKAAAVDRRVSVREMLEKVFGLISRFKSRDELLDEEFDKFVADSKPDEAAAIPAIRHYFKAYVSSDQIRHIIEAGHYQDLATNPLFNNRDFRAVPPKYRALIPEYVKDYVSLNQFVA